MTDLTFHTISNGKKDIVFLNLIEEEDRMQTSACLHNYYNDVCDILATTAREHTSARC